MINYNKFFAAYRAAFGPLTQQQVDGLVFLLAGFNIDSRWADRRNVAYALATIKHETADTYRPIEERGSKLYLSKYWWRLKIRRDLGNTQLSDAWNYKGRGYSMITGRRNYTLFGKLLGTSLVDYPALALERDTAFEILTRGMFDGLFTGRALGRFINAKGADYYNARTVINGHDDARLIEGYARRFEVMLMQSEEDDRYTISPSEASTGSLQDG